MRRWALALAGLAAFGGPAAAQDLAPDSAAVPVPGAVASAPPPGGLVPPVHEFALGVALGTLRWDDAAPYDDLATVGLSLERRLGRYLGGRVGVTAGKAALPVESDEVDVWVMSFDLQVLVPADFGPFRRTGVVPYALAGVGTLVTNPTGEGAGELPTRSQSQWGWGGGVRARVAQRWEARAEAASMKVRLADPVEAEAMDTETIHNLRMEGSVQWRF